MDEKEQEVVDFLIERYGPKAILLFGSRADGTSKESSDWDIFVIGATKNTERDSDLITTPGGNLLDIAFKAFPTKGEPLTTAIKPLWPAKVLLDASGGVLEEVLKTNERALEQGPLLLYENGILRRYRILSRRQSKVEKHKSDKESQFIFSGAVLELAIRLWFELRNEWALPAEKAMGIIEDKDPQFRKMLDVLCVGNSVEKIKASQDIVETLKNTIQKVLGPKNI